MSRRFRIAAAQYPIEHVATFEHWVNKTRRWVSEAAAQGAQLLLFPEYGSCDTLDLVAGEAAAGLGAAGQSLLRQLEAHQSWLPKLKAHFHDLAQQYAVVIVAGSWFEWNGDGFANRTWAFAPNAESAHADKVMLTPEERRYGLKPGASSSLIETQWGRIGIAVCYDCEFPLLVRKLVEHGAELVLVPSCTDTLAGYHRVRIGCQARALENQCFMAQAVTVGDAPWSALLDRNRGAAGLYCPPDVGLPDTGVIAAGTLDEAQWVYGDIDLDLLQHARNHGQVSGHRDWSNPKHLAASASVHDLRARR